MSFLPDADVWTDEDAEGLVTRVRTWHKVIQTLIGPRDGSKIEDRVAVYLTRAVDVQSALSEYEQRLRSGLTVRPRKIAEDLEWVLEHVSPFSRNIMLDQYSSEIVRAEYDELLCEFERLSAVQGPNSPEVEKMKQQLIAQGDQIETVCNDLLRAGLQRHPDGAKRVPQDIREQLGIKDEWDDETRESDQ